MDRGKSQTKPFTSRAGRVGQLLRAWLVTWAAVLVLWPALGSAQSISGATASPNTYDAAGTVITFSLTLVIPNGGGAVQSAVLQNATGVVAAGLSPLT